MCSLLEYLHSNSIIHRDLKAQNMIFDTGNKEIYIIDFDIAKLTKNKDDDIQTRVMGTDST